MSRRTKLNLESYIAAGQVMITNCHARFHFNRRTVHLGLGSDCEAARLGRVANEITRNSDMLLVQLSDGAGEELTSCRGRYRRVWFLSMDRSHSAYQDRNSEAQKTGLAQAVTHVAEFPHKTVLGW